MAKPPRAARHHPSDIADVHPLHQRLAQAIEHAAHLLPAQGPITVFIHHNTLHAFEDLPFTEAVKRAARVFGCQPYLSEARYREELGRGRIRRWDLESVIRADLRGLADEPILKLCTRLELRLAMLEYPLQTAPQEELLWFVAETDALRRFRGEVSAAVKQRLIAETRRWTMRDLRGMYQAARNGGSAPRRPALIDGLLDLLRKFGEARIESWSDSAWEAFTLQALWRICQSGVEHMPELLLPPLSPGRHRDLLQSASGADSDLLVHDLLVKSCGAFLDQGLAHWPLPRREEGFYRSFLALYRQGGGSPAAWTAGLSRELARLDDERTTPLESIRQSLDELGIAEDEWDEFLSATLLALRGWAGMQRFLEERPDRAVNPVPQGSLVEFLAVRLLLDRLALAHVARETLAYTGPLSELRDELRRRVAPAHAPTAPQRAFRVFQLAQALGWSPEALHRLSEADWATLVEEIEVFAPIERRRVFHVAYENQFYAMSLDAISLHAAAPAPEPPRPRFQAMFCIDEREESLRRHIEELAPEASTFGIAGFYFVDMYYRGAADAHFVPLCPAVMRPGHWVVEEVEANHEEIHQRSAKARRAVGLASHQIHVGTRKFALGALLSVATGVLASAPLIARTLFPRLTAQLRKTLGRMVLAGPRTRLLVERAQSPPGPENGHIGYTLEEMVAIAERVLRDTGLTGNFARLVFTFGHGSTSMNNPHESAHDCGACGGARGGPNGRAIAQILNDPRVRLHLAERGIDVPAETLFVGGMHNTSSETISFADLDRLPESHRQELEEARGILEEACDRDAHERSRRFESASLTQSFGSARRHVEGRAEDLAQVRPEWGHATNALTIVGRRQRTRGLFLDRRAFLNSYDPDQDDHNATILTRILAAAVPVCAGISLEYYFSYVDNTGYGSGTKLPHNVASLLGVMDGAASDLRTGLPWQMVEIHEPMRHLFVIETRPEMMLRILDRSPGIHRLVRNGWIQLATLDPDSTQIHFYRGGAFHPYHPQATELPEAASSVDWYRGWRDHLEFARIVGQGNEPAARKGASHV